MTTEKSRNADNFADRLREAMELRKITQSELARDLGTAWSTVARWLEGSVPRRKTLLEISETLSVASRWLEEGEGPMEKPGWGQESSSLKEPEVSYGSKTKATLEQEAAEQDAIARSAKGIGLGLDAELSVALTDIRIRLQQLHLASKQTRARYIAECHQQIDRYAASVAEKFKD